MTWALWGAGGVKGTGENVRRGCEAVLDCAVVWVGEVDGLMAWWSVAVIWMVQAAVFEVSLYRSSSYVRY